MNPSRAKELLDNFTPKKILVVGDVVLDHYIYGAVERLNPEAPVPILNAQKESYSTGGAGNTAKNVAALGAKAICIGVCGDDKAAAQLKETAQAEKYKIRLVVDSDRPTIEKIRYVVNTHHLLRVDYEKISEISSETEQSLIKEITDAIVDVDGVIVSDYAKGVITQTVAEAINELARKHNVPVLADVKPSRINYFTGVTYISPNRKEAHEYLGLNQHDGGGRSAEQLAGLLRETFATTVFLTLAADGMYVLGQNAKSGAIVPQMYVKADQVLDTSGCGDTAAAAILLSKLAGASDEEAADLANAASGTKAHKIGAVGVVPDEVLEILTHHHEQQG